MPYRHYHSAHCESGVVAGLLRHEGIDLPEHMVFGLASGLCFTYLPWIKFNGMPLISYRMYPHALIGAISRRLGIRFSIQRYNDPGVAMDDLKRCIDGGQIVGLQTSAYWLPYFPSEMRFQFNLHNLIVYGYDKKRFLISDPVFEHTLTINEQDLQNARFARGTFAPRGYSYHLSRLPERIDLSTAIYKSLVFTVHVMRHAPLSFIGCRAIKTVAAVIQHHHGKHPKQLKRFLVHLIRMQEEIGTGGGGFRFMYAAYLQDVALRLDLRELETIAADMTASGDAWRQVASLCGRVAKENGPVDIQPVVNALHRVHAYESRTFGQLASVLKTVKRKIREGKRHFIFREHTC